MRFELILLLVFISCISNTTRETEKPNALSKELGFGFEITFSENEVFDNFIILWGMNLYHNNNLIYEDTITEFEVIDNNLYPSIRRVGDNEYELLIISNDRPNISKLQRLVFLNDKIQTAELLPFFVTPRDTDNDGILEVGGIMSYYELIGEKADTMPYVPILIYEYTDYDIYLDTLTTIETNSKIYGDFYGYKYSEDFKFKKKEGFQEEFVKYR